MMKNVTVHVPDKLNLEQSQKLLAQVLGKVGHPACYSGINISFHNIVAPADRVLSVDKALNIIEVGH